MAQKEISMKKFAAAIALAAASIMLAGCATTQTTMMSNVPERPIVDVSKMEHGKKLTATEIEVIVSGKQMVGTVLRSDGKKVPGLVLVLESNGVLRGSLHNETDHGKWSVDQKTDRLCNVWSRWLSGCSQATVHNGKLHLLNLATGGQYLQQ